MSEEYLFRLLVPTLFEAICESRSFPFILFIKDASKSVVGNGELYAIFRRRLEKLPENVIVIGSHTYADNHNEKSHPGEFPSTKFGSNQAALSDLASQENFGQMDYRREEVAEATKILSELFPNKVTVYIPQDKYLVVKWKQ